MNKYTYNTLVLVGTIALTATLAYFNEAWAIGMFLLLALDSD